MHVFVSLSSQIGVSHKDQAAAHGESPRKHYSKSPKCSFVTASTLSGLRAWIGEISFLKFAIIIII